MKFSALSLRTKILAAGIGLPLILAMIALYAYAQQTRRTAVEGMVEKAKAICTTVEAVRESMDERWESGFYTAEMLKAWGEAGEKEKILSSIPVVAAWRTAEKGADENHYEFRVPKFKPRNPKNQPDAIESEVLRLFERGGVREHHVIDKEINAVRYFRAIRLTESCLVCHGDPANAAKLWGNDRGLDITGGTMENWKVGEVHGAFEVIQYLDEADKKLASTTIWVVLLVVGAMALLAVAYVFITNLSLKPVERLNARVRQIARAT
jgi:methyl-accepting chemotaxis protein